MFGGIFPRFAVFGGPRFLVCVCVCVCVRVCVCRHVHT